MLFKTFNQASCRVTLLPLNNLPAKEAFIGIVSDFKNERLLLSSPEPLSAFQAITVEYEDMLFLGEVLACTSESEGKWTILVKVEQVLTALQSLMRLREQLLRSEQGIRSTPESESILAA